MSEKSSHPQCCVSLLAGWLAGWETNDGVKAARSTAVCWLKQHCSMRDRGKSLVVCHLMEDRKGEKTRQLQFKNVHMLFYAFQLTL